MISPNMGLQYAARSHWLKLLLTVILAFTSMNTYAQNEEDAGQEEHDAWLEAVANTDDPAEKFQLTVDYLEDEPKGRGIFVYRAFRTLLDASMLMDGSSDKALAAMDDYLAHTAQSEGASSFELIYLEALVNSKRQSEFKPRAEEFLEAAGNNQSFYQRTIARIAVNGGEYDYGISLLNNGLESIRAEISAAADAAEAARYDRQLSGLLADIAVAQFKAGMITDSLDSFERAFESAGTDVMGKPFIRSSFQQAANYYYGKALIAGGQPEKGKEILAYIATIKADKEAEAELERMFKQENGQDANFAQYLRKMHEGFLKPVPAFALESIDGTRVDSQSFKNQVTLIYIWSHT